MSAPASITSSRDYSSLQPARNLTQGTEQLPFSTVIGNDISIVCPNPTSLPGSTAVSRSYTAETRMTGVAGSVQLASACICLVAGADVAVRGLGLFVSGRIAVSASAFIQKFSRRERITRFRASQLLSKLVNHLIGVSYGKSWDGTPQECMSIFSRLEKMVDDEDCLDVVSVEECSFSRLSSSSALVIRTDNEPEATLVSAPNGVFFSAISGSLIVSPRSISGLFVSSGAGMNFAGLSLSDDELVLPLSFVGNPSSQSAIKLRDISGLTAADFSELAKLIKAPEGVQSALASSRQVQTFLDSEGISGPSSLPYSLATAFDVLSLVEGNNASAVARISSALSTRMDESRRSTMLTLANGQISHLIKLPPVGPLNIDPVPSGTEVTACCKLDGVGICVKCESQERLIITNASVEFVLHPGVMVDGLREDISCQLAAKLLIAVAKEHEISVFELCFSYASTILLFELVGNFGLSLYHYSSGSPGDRVQRLVRPTLVLLAVDGVPAVKKDRFFDIPYSFATTVGELQGLLSEVQIEGFVCHSIVQSLEHFKIKNILFSYVEQISAQFPLTAPSNSANRLRNEARLRYDDPSAFSRAIVKVEADFERRLGVRSEFFDDLRDFLKGMDMNILSSKCPVHVSTAVWSSLCGRRTLTDVFKANLIVLLTHPIDSVGNFRFPEKRAGIRQAVWPFIVEFEMAVVSRDKSATQFASMVTADSLRAAHSRVAREIHRLQKLAAIPETYPLWVFASGRSGLPGPKVWKRDLIDLSSVPRVPFPEIPSTKKPALPRPSGDPAQVIFRDNRGLRRGLRALRLMKGFPDGPDEQFDLMVSGEYYSPASWQFMFDVIDNPAFEGCLFRKVLHRGVSWVTLPPATCTFSSVGGYEYQAGSSSSLRWPLNGQPFRFAVFEVSDDAIQKADDDLSHSTSLKFVQAKARETAVAVAPVMRSLGLSGWSCGIVHETRSVPVNHFHCANSLQPGTSVALKTLFSLLFDADLSSKQINQRFPSIEVFRSDRLVASWREGFFFTEKRESPDNVEIAQRFVSASLAAMLTINLHRFAPPSQFHDFIDTGGVDWLKGIHQCAWHPSGRPQRVLAALMLVNIGVFRFCSNTTGTGALIPYPFSRGSEIMIKEVGDAVEGGFLQVDDKAPVAIPFNTNSKSSISPLAKFDEVNASRVTIGVRMNRIHKEADLSRLFQKAAYVDVAVDHVTRSGSNNKKGTAVASSRIVMAPFVVAQRAVTYLCQSNRDIAGHPFVVVSVGGACNVPGSLLNIVVINALTGPTTCGMTYGLSECITRIASHCSLDHPVVMALSAVRPQDVLVDVVKNCGFDVNTFLGPEMSEMLEMSQLIAAVGQSAQGASLGRFREVAAAIEEGRFAPRALLSKLAIGGSENLRVVVVAAADLNQASVGAHSSMGAVLSEYMRNFFTTYFSGPVFCRYLLSLLPAGRGPLEYAVDSSAYALQKARLPDLNFSVQVRGSGIASSRSCQQLASDEAFSVALAIADDYGGGMENATKKLADVLLGSGSKSTFTAWSHKSMMSFSFRDAFLVRASPAVTSLAALSGRSSQSDSGVVFQSQIVGLNPADPADQERFSSFMRGGLSFMGHSLIGLDRLDVSSWWKVPAEGLYQPKPVADTFSPALREVIIAAESGFFVGLQQGAVCFCTVPSGYCLTIPDGLVGAFSSFRCYIGKRVPFTASISWILMR